MTLSASLAVSCRLPIANQMPTARRLHCLRNPAILDNLPATPALSCAKNTVEFCEGAS